MATAAVVGAPMGDILAFLLARRLHPWLARPGRRGAVLARAQALVARRGASGVFLSRWLITPLGPASNYVAGAAGLSLPRFMAASVPGKAIWVAVHFTFGHRGGVAAFAEPKRRHRRRWPWLRRLVSVFGRCSSGGNSAAVPY